MEIKIEQSWKVKLQEEFVAPYFQELTEKVKQLYLNKLSIYPPPKFIFSAFELCPFNEVEVVILGQDPYHGKGQAHGLCFSVPEGIPTPPSLKNIYKEIEADLGVTISSFGNLERWAKQGVLLLNATLSVEAGKPGSHQGIGWETFTDAVIRKISEEKENVVFLLWGRYAQAKVGLIDTERHLVLTAPHPSPFSAHSGFFGCRHFSKTNDYLVSKGKKPIAW
jgi:uracil-DNA glycosylase